MVIVRLIGGLGSQMSEYAFAKALQNMGYQVKLDISAFKYYRLHNYELSHYNIDLECSTDEENAEYQNNSFVIKLLKKLLPIRIFRKSLHITGINFYNSKVIEEKSFLFESQFLKIKGDSYLIGDFKSEKYFKSVRGTLLKQFTIKNEYSHYVQEMGLKISESSNSCFIHVRRGDFANNPKVNKVHGVCSVEYYNRAVSYMKTKVRDLQFFIFSNDIDWCEKYLVIENATYMNNQDRSSPHEDLHLMSLCNHSIIDHSAFCWWGAWLNQNEEAIVVAPERWFSDDELQKQSGDIYCKSWVKL